MDNSILNPELGLSARLEISVGRVETENGVVDCKCFVATGSDVSFHLYANDGRRSGVYIVMDWEEFNLFKETLIRAVAVFEKCKE